MSRPIDATTLAQIQGQTIYAIWFIRLDLQNDPVYIHSGLGNITFPSSGYDSALNGLTFNGVGNIGSIDPIVDSIDGSQSINLTLPGVDLSLDYLHQIVNNGDLWQRKQAWLFFGVADTNFALLGKPVRIKTARIDQMPITIDPDNNTGTLQVTLESLQSYNDEARFSRYSEQTQVDSTDISCSFMANLANYTPDIGVKNVAPYLAAQSKGIIQIGGPVGGGPP